MGTACSGFCPSSKQMEFGSPAASQRLDREKVVIFQHDPTSLVDRARQTTDGACVLSRSRVDTRRRSELSTKLCGSSMSDRCKEFALWTNMALSDPSIYGYSRRDNVFFFLFFSFLFLFFLLSARYETYRRAPCIQQPSLAAKLLGLDSVQRRTRSLLEGLSDFTPSVDEAISP